MKRIASWLLAAVLGLSVIATASADGSSYLEMVRMQMAKAGLPPGYLATSALPAGLTLLPPPPAAGSAAEQRDIEANAAALALAGSDAARKAMAAADANTQFPAVTQTFTCALGLEITEAATPTLYRLIRRTFADFALATMTVKQHYQRPRPFMVNGQPSCVPADEERLRKDGSYPSGHSAYGFGWSMVLAGVAPDHSDALLRRGIEYGASREVCNVHWQSDVEQGRIIAAAVFARLQGEPEFRRDVEAARAEVEAARRGTPTAAVTAAFASCGK
ncbi:MAG: phosphatase PAP2 family protein [Gammaproteobacteria bacterium]|nr:phosphatase PAP2 family protein [Gammaproteobacteria bacterium]